MISTIRQGSCNRARGFTLVELMVVLAVGAILLALAAPSFSEMLLNNRKTVIVNELIGDLNLARGEAIKRRQPVQVCPRSGAACGSASNWDEGWIVFADLDTDRVLSPGDPVLKFRQAEHENFTIRTTAEGGVRYLASGGVAPGTNQTFYFCDVRGTTHARAVFVSGTGRTRLDHATTCG